VAISGALQGQAAALEQCEAAHARAAAALAAAGGVGSGGGDGGGLVEALRDEVARLRAQVDEEQPREIAGRQQRLGALRAALGIEVRACVRAHMHAGTHVCM
jgi:hypothetical protein